MSPRSSHSLTNGCHFRMLNSLRLLSRHWAGEKVASDLGLGGGF